ncbi:MAG: RNase P subunit p30 family protein [Candidatus Micrarchaeota archaeon]
MNYYDLNPANPALREKQAKLGYSPAPACRNIVLRSGKDIPTQREFNAVSSANSALLVEACKRGTATLVMPLDSPEYWKNDALLMAAVDKNRVFEIPLRPLLHARHAQRAKLIGQPRFFLRRCVKQRAHFVITSRAESEYDLKSPREAIALGQLLGLTKQQAQHALSKECERLLAEGGFK